MAFSISPKISTFALAMLVIANLLISDHLVVAKTCNADIQGLVSQCQKYVQKSGPKTAPSESCCAYIKTIDVPCACKFVTKGVEQMISMDKAIYVARTCGVNIESGTKCGSYIVPPA